MKVRGWAWLVAAVLVTEAPVAVGQPERAACSRDGQTCRPGVRECCDTSASRCEIVHFPGEQGWPYGQWVCRPCGAVGQRCCRRPGSSACEGEGCRPGLTADLYTEVCR